jgi:hypothetical protein
MFTGGIGKGANIPMPLPAPVTIATLPSKPAIRMYQPNHIALKTFQIWTE